jgi:hypothetical protein
MKAHLKTIGTIVGMLAGVSLVMNFGIEFPKIMTVIFALSIAIMLYIAIFTLFKEKP